MTRTILGLDIGGANLKAATPDGRAVSVPFALWKQPDRLPSALAELVGRFADVGELAVTMTGELCDCYETKRQGVNAILGAVEHAAAGRPVRVWGTGGEFLTVAASRAEYMTVAAANWHALAMFVGRWVPEGRGLLVDIGSTTTDLTAIVDGRVRSSGLTDPARLRTGELLYTGVRRTPVCSVLAENIAAELFATMQDVYLVLRLVTEEPEVTDTADGRPATRECALSRLARMECGDRETHGEGEIENIAARAALAQNMFLSGAIRQHHFERLEAGPLRAVVLAGGGEFLAREVMANLDITRHDTTRLLLSDRLGPTVSACAPAYAVAVLASERPL